MAQKETKIWMALKSRISTLPSTYPIAWPASVFTPPKGADGVTPYIRAGYVNSTPSRVQIDDGKPYIRTGFLILSLVYPLGRQAGEVMIDEAAKIADHFNDGVEMRFDNVCVSVTGYPSVQDGYEDNGYYTIPVSVPWRTFL